MLHYKNFALDTGGSLAASYTSPTLDIRVYEGCSLQAVFTGSPAGTLSLQVSNDGVTYSAYPSSSTTIAAAGNYFWDLPRTQAAYVQIAYARTGGTGSINIQVNAKVL